MPPRHQNVALSAQAAPRSAGAARAAAAFAFGAMLMGSSYASAAEKLHIVARGQTLYALAKRYRTTPDALREANGLKPGELIHPGRALVLPETGHDAKAAKNTVEPRSADKRSELGRRTSPSAGGRASRLEERGRAGRGDERGRPVEVGLAAKRNRPGRVTFARGTEHAEVQLLGRHGRLAPAALATVGRMLRFYPTGAKISVDPRLAILIGLVSDHFGGRPLHVVSGFRPFSPRQYTPHSNHNAGRAFDFAVEGVPNAVVRDFCRTFHSAGVGFYPASTFVHLDVRAEQAYWVDYSSAGEAPRYKSPVEQSAADESAGEVDVSVPIPGSQGSRGTLHPTEQATEIYGETPTDRVERSDSAGKRGSDDPPGAP